MIEGKLGMRNSIFEERSKLLALLFLESGFIAITDTGSEYVFSPLDLEVLPKFTLIGSTEKYSGKLDFTMDEILEYFSPTYFFPISRWKNIEFC